MSMKYDVFGPGPLGVSILVLSLERRGDLA